MKTRYIVIVSIMGLFILLFVWFIQTMGGGGGRHLGATAIIELNCSQLDANQQLDVLLMEDSFKISESDSTIVKWWERADYDFLNYVCINLQGKLYMITLTSENFKESELSIRAYYNRNKAKWIFAAEFSGTDKKEAKNAQKYLLSHMIGCK